MTAILINNIPVFSDSLNTSIAVLNENFVGSTSVTTLALEDGAVITDHIKILPATLTLEIEIANISELSGGGDILGSEAKLVAEALKIAREAKQTITVITSFSIYNNMIIQNLDMSSKLPYTNSLVISLLLQELVFFKNNFIGRVISSDYIRNATPSGAGVAKKTTDINSSLFQKINSYFSGF